jgi:hypothetical protein
LAVERVAKAAHRLVKRREILKGRREGVHSRGEQLDDRKVTIR